MQGSSSCTHGRSVNTIEIALLLVRVFVGSPEISQCLSLRRGAKKKAGDV